MLVSWLFRILNKRINNFWGTEYFVMPYILLYRDSTDLFHESIFRNDRRIDYL